MMNSKEINQNNNKNINFLNPQGIFTPEEEQEKRDTLRKTKISERHSLELTNYYEYDTPDGKEKDLNEHLTDMSFYGEITKKEILRLKEEDPDRFISIDEAIEKGSSNSNFGKYKNEYFVLAILAKNLMNEGCIVAIEKDKPSNENENNELNTSVQFLVNGMYNLKNIFFILILEKKKIMNY